MDAGRDSEIESFRTDLAEARRALVRRLEADPRALSADGQTFAFVSPVAARIPVGGYVRLRTDAGVDYLGQVTAKSVVERDGPEVVVAGDAGLGTSAASERITHTSFRVRLRSVNGGGVLLGRSDGEAIVPTVATDVFEDASITVADAATVEHYLRGHGAGRGELEIGTLRFGDNLARASMLATGFDRHTFFCGQSGSGKTYALGVILERLLLETDLRIVVIDPNADFVRLGQPRLGAAGDAALRERYLAATERLRVLRPAPYGSAAPGALRARFSDFAATVQGMTLQLDPLADREEFNAFAGIIERFGDRPYSLADVRAAAAADLSEAARRVALRIANLGIAEWDVWAESGDAPLGGTAKDWRAVVFDIGGFARPEEKSLVALGVLDLAWRQREERQPVLLVIDEAHNVCPLEPADRIQAATTERLVQIAGEGRKFGIYLLVASQRPQKIHPNVLSQSDNLVLMRMNSAADIAHLAATFSFVPAPLLERASHFGQGESLLAGKIVPSPLFVRFGGRISEEGGGDVPTTWASPRAESVRATVASGPPARRLS